MARIIIDHPEADRRINGRPVSIVKKGTVASTVRVLDEGVKIKEWLVTNDVIKEVPDEPRSKDMAESSTQP